jgi:hypothetical protein
MAGIYVRFGDIIYCSASFAKRTDQSFAAIKRFQFCSFFRFAKDAPCSGAGDEGGGGELQLVSIV